MHAERLGRQKSPFPRSRWEGAYSVVQYLCCVFVLLTCWSSSCGALRPPGGGPDPAVT